MVGAHHHHGEEGIMTRRLSESLFSWASILEDDTREQALRTSAMPFIYPHMALMPDAHLVVIWTGFRADRHG